MSRQRWLLNHRFSPWTFVQWNSEKFRSWNTEWRAADVRAEQTVWWWRFCVEVFVHSSAGVLSFWRSSEDVLWWFIYLLLSCDLAHVLQERKKKHLQSLLKILVHFPQRQLSFCFFWIFLNFLLLFLSTQPPSTPSHPSMLRCRSTFITMTDAFTMKLMPCTPCTGRWSCFLWCFLSFSIFSIP